jgi:hypothetical protein
MCSRASSDLPGRVLIVPGNSLLVFGELVGAGFLTLAVVLLALAATAAALHSGAAHHPVPAPVNGSDSYEEQLFARYVRGDINAAEYHDRLAAAANRI